MPRITSMAAFRAAAGLGAIAALAGCATKKVEERPAVAGPAARAPRPLPPYGAAGTVVVPSHGADGSYQTINSGISDQEAIWHLRSALNVAALSCDPQGKIGLAAKYNAMLKRQKKGLATAYRAEGKRFGSGNGFDQHLTQIYNFFALPPVKPSFCKVATEVANETATLHPADLTAFAVRSLARLTAPFDNFYRAYERYQVELAAWERKYPASNTKATALQSSSSAAGWRVQFGTYSGDEAARKAWGKVRARVKRAASFQPHYERVPGKQMVRLQIGPVTARDEAEAICAAAENAGFDCLPVAS